MKPNQISIDFTTKSPINQPVLSGQNKRLYDYLLTGASIHCMHDAVFTLRIGYLNSRISDLINKHHIPIFKRNIKVKAGDGAPVDVKEYSLKPFEQ
jgi:hypothetical protein